MCDVVCFNIIISSWTIKTLQRFFTWYSFPVEGQLHFAQHCKLLLDSSVQLLSHARLLATPWIAAHQAFLSITNSRSSFRLAFIESVMMPSSHLILGRPLLLLPPIPPSIRVFSSESTLHMTWPKYWSFSFSVILPMNTQDWSPLGWTGWISLQYKPLEVSICRYRNPHWDKPWPVRMRADELLPPLVSQPSSHLSFMRLLIHPHLVKEKSGPRGSQLGACPGSGFFSCL